MLNLENNMQVGLEEALNIVKDFIISPIVEKELINLQYEDNKINSDYNDCVKFIETDKNCFWLNKYGNTLMDFNKKNIISFKIYKDGEAIYRLYIDKVGRKILKVKNSKEEIIEF